VYLRRLARVVLKAISAAAQYGQSKVNPDHTEVRRETISMGLKFVWLVSQQLAAA